MLRARKDVDWTRYLAPSDLTYLKTRIDPAQWYPLATFERLGIAILREIAGGDLEVVKQFGRVSFDGLCALHENLVAPGDPNESLLRFRVLRQSFFDFPALSIEEVLDDEACALVGFGMGAVAEEAATCQTMGFLERLLELAGATGVRVWLSERSWLGDPATRIQMDWDAPPGR